MSPLSVLPGRVRFETSRLVGCKEESALFEESILCAQGVIEASVSHRTGRVLVRFDESQVSHGEIEDHVGKALQAATAPGAREQALRVPRREPAGESSFHAGHFLMELAVHALLPAPLDLLLPAAATVFRRPV